MEHDIKIAIADDHNLVRSGISNLLISKGLNVVFEAENGQVLLDYISENPVHVVLMDLNMPVMNGWETTAALKEKYPDVHVIGLSMFDDDLSVLKVIRAGARGYLLKDAEPDELIQAITDVHSKGYYHSELVSGFLYKNYSGGEEGELDASEIHFSDRESDFLQHCCSELTYKEIADKMNVSHRTVDGYRESLFVKLGARSRVGIVLAAIKLELIDF